MTSLPELYENRINLVLNILEQDNLECLMNTLLALGDCINTLMSEQPEFHQANLSERLRGAANQSRCRCTHILLLGNCVDLLNAGVLLLLTGYNSRALSCVRDVYEGLRVADACLNNADAATNWLDGKAPKKPKGHKYPDVIALEQKADAILNVWGTHPHYESTMSAWFSRARLSGQLNDSDRFFIWRDFITLISASSKSLSYVLERHPILTSKVSGVEQKLQEANCLAQTMLAEVVQMYNDLVGTKKD